MKPQVRVGVAAIVADAQGRMVMGIRKGSSAGSGQWQFPGGHLEMGETFFGCAERETLEETGLVVRAEKLVAVTNDVFDAATRHYITVFVLCRRVDETQEPMVMEPEKCESWAWKTWSDVRTVLSAGDGERNLFLPIVNLLRDNPNIEAMIQATDAAR